MNINHTKYPKTLKNKSITELYFIVKDAREAIEAMPDGHKAGYYADEVSYAAMEIKARQT